MRLLSPIRLLRACLMVGLVLLCVASCADAGIFGRVLHPFRGHQQCQAQQAPAPCTARATAMATYSASYSATYQATLPTAPDVAPSGDHGFTAWLNERRAENGRGPVRHDPGLSGQAAVNNRYGFGHHYMGSARRQNAGMGSAGTVWQMWMASPAHQAALLDPTITTIGIAASGSIWTFNAY